MTKLSAQVALIAQLASAIKIQTSQGFCNNPWNPATWLQTTDETFELEVPCATRLDTDCDCFPEGLVDWDNGQEPENYFNSDAYQALDREEKLAELWEQLTGTARGLNKPVPARVKC